VIPSDPSAAEWLDSFCWACGSTQVASATGDSVLCVPCRRELLSEPSIDVVGLARHAYWESHALLCCWRCMTAAVDPGDEVGLCPSCREAIDAPIEEGAA